MANSRQEDSESENLPLMAKSIPSTWSSKFKRHFNAQIDTKRADIILIICFFVSGLTDSGAYNAWNIFLSMQTGNTIFAALGLSNLPDGTTKTQLLKSLCAILSFLLGALFFSTLHRTLTPRKRYVLILSFTIQTSLIIISALLIQSGCASDSSPKKPVDTPPDHDHQIEGTQNLGPTHFPFDLLPITLLSFQASATVIASRVLAYAQLPTIVISTLYADLVSDPSFFSGGLVGNTPRNRRAGGVAFYFVGAVLGGVFASRREGFEGALWVAALVKGVVGLTWVGWWEERGEDGD
ncbi:hypothetical protein E6O75_ATG10885 [Venturia nashicola]|uniref:DUF1275 domain protein n=1 Tax=Venturia nashicola TaxID=86259 RepID=A0A4Z1PB99_9PEZI|nr:hypothetical protein E6O75_ATG10885 [Venturia nashicola]